MVAGQFHAMLDSGVALVKCGCKSSDFEVAWLGFMTGLNLFCCLDVCHHHHHPLQLPLCQETYEVVAGSIPEIESNAEAAHLVPGSLGESSMMRIVVKS